MTPQDDGLPPSPQQAAPHRNGSGRAAARRPGPGAQWAEEWIDEQTNGYRQQSAGHARGHGEARPPARPRRPRSRHADPSDTPRH